MKISAITSTIAIFFSLLILAVFVTLIVLVIRALLKYLKSKEVRVEKTVIKRSLGEALKFHRTRCKMTQEFVAETIGVSRQAVSKWEKGDSDPRLPPWRRTVPMPWPRPSTPSRTAGCPTTPWSLPRMAPSAASSASGCRKFCSKPLTNVLRML